MRFERLTSPSHPLYGRAMELYRISFPPHEQRQSPSQAAILADAGYHFDLIWDGDTFVGLLLYWERENTLYIEHFCIQPQLRNRRYGQQALTLLQETGNTLILEIDPPVDDISLRRKGFYERCGFAANPYPHVHPPYHEGNRGHALVVMSSPAPISQTEYDAFAADLSARVMAHAFF